MRTTKKSDADRESQHEKELTMTRLPDAEIDELVEQFADGTVWRSLALELRERIALWLAPWLGES